MTILLPLKQVYVPDPEETGNDSRKEWQSFRHPIKFDKGKSAIAVPSRDKISAVIDTLITAVRNGELDEQLARTKKRTVGMKSRKAA